LPPKVEVYQIDTGGVREKMSDWTMQAQKNVVAAVEEELKGRSRFLIRSLSADSFLEEGKSNLEETYQLFDTVNISIVMHTYPPPAGVFPFEEKIKNFDYSLGQEVGRLTQEKADALIVLNGVDHVWTAGRQALQALGVILGIGAGVATGVYVIPVLGGGTELSVALVDPQNGSILWYNRKGAGGGYDLRNQESVANLVKDLFKDFPLPEGVPKGKQ
jgi:hypothetical protein